MDQDEDAKINNVEYYTMQQMLENLVNKETITRREMDLTLERIAIEDNLVDILYSHYDYQQKLTTATNVVMPNPSYIREMVLFHLFRVGSLH